MNITALLCFLYAVAAYVASFLMPEDGLLWCAVGAAWLAMAGVFRLKAEQEKRRGE